MDRGVGETSPFHSLRCWQVPSGSMSVMAWLRQLRGNTPHGASCKKKSRPLNGAADRRAKAGQSYSTGFGVSLLADSTQLVTPPVLATKRVIGNFGAHST